MPVDNWFVIFFQCTIGNTFVSVAVHDLQLLGFLFFALYSNIDVGNLPVHDRNQVNAGDLGDDLQDFGAFPRVINERCASIMIVSTEQLSKGW